MRRKCQNLQAANLLLGGRIAKQNVKERKKRLWHQKAEREDFEPLLTKTSRQTLFMYIQNP
jgi:hypothetical protein